MRSCRNKLAYWSSPETKYNLVYCMHGSYYIFKLLAVSYGTSSMSFKLQSSWSHKITNAYRTMKHGLLQGLTAPIAMGITMLEQVFINVNLSCIQWYQREGFKRYSQTHQNYEKWFISRVHSSISDGDVTCCIQQFESHVHRWQGSSDMIGQRYHTHQKHRNRSLIWCKLGLDSALHSYAMGA